VRAALTPEAIEATRAELTEIATRLFVQNGVEALSLRKLAAAAGMSRTTPYGYFESKQEIIDSIRAAGFDRLTSRAAAGIEAASGPLAKMQALGRAVVRFACDEPEVYGLIFSGPVFTGEVSAVLARAVARFREVSRPPLDEAIRRGLVRGDPDALRRVTWAAFHGLVLLHLHGHSDAKQLEIDFDFLDHVIGHGILGRRDPHAEESTTGHPGGGPA
jgi:AcrR family transcriptional regulator